MKEYEKDEAFLRAIRVVLQDEGGYVNDPDDPGGETNWGISKRQYSYLDIASLTQDEAVEIYYRDYWKPYNFKSIPYEKLRIKLFDIAVVAGPRSVIVLLQRTLNLLSSNTQVKVDGVLGKQTLAMIMRFPEDVILNTFIQTAKEYFTMLNKKKFLAGWVRRLEKPIKIT